MISPFTNPFRRLATMAISSRVSAPVECSKSRYPAALMTDSTPRIIATYVGLPMSATARPSWNVRPARSERAAASGT